MEFYSLTSTPELNAQGAFYMVCIWYSRTIIICNMLMSVHDMHITCMYNVMYMAL